MKIDQGQLIGLIPAAGKGLRLGLPYPKELYPIIKDNKFKPISQYVVENLLIGGVKHIVFVINETKDQILSYYGNGVRFGCSFSYVVQESRKDSGKSGGLSEALNSAYHLTKGKWVAFGMADSLMRPKTVFKEMIHKMQPGIDVAMGIFRCDDPRQLAPVVMDKTGSISRIIDKPKRTSLKNTWGCIIWNARFTTYLREMVDRGMHDFADIMNTAIKKEGMDFQGITFNRSRYRDIGTYEEIKKLNQELVIDRHSF